MNFLLFIYFVFVSNILAEVEDASEVDLLEFFGLNDVPHGTKLRSRPLRNSASKFMQQVYSEINEEKVPAYLKSRGRRTTVNDDNFITYLDRLEMEKCDNIITFSNKKKNLKNKQKMSTSLTPPTNQHARLHFNIKNVPNDLDLMYSTLRLHMDPALGNETLPKQPQNVTISIYKRKLFQPNFPSGMINFRMFTSLNVTTTHKGWLEFNTTRLLNEWLKLRKLRPLKRPSNELLVVVTTEDAQELNARHIGLAIPGMNEEFNDQNPFIIGYFNGPQLIEKIRKIRSKRAIKKNPRHHRTSRLQFHHDYQSPKICSRLNFTVNFEETHMDSWVIAPKKFEAFFCSGECSFPLGAHMNTTHHAIVQSLMHIQQTNLPKPCCAPTVLRSIQIVRYLNEDNVNMVKFPDSIVEECGCL